MTTEIRKYLDRYGLERDVSKGYLGQLRITLDRFRDYLGHEPTVADLIEDLANRWIASMLESGQLARQTVRTQRRNLLVLWRAMFEDRLVDVEPRRVRKVKLERSVPEAWDEAQLWALLIESQKCQGVFKRSRVNKAAFWRAFILTAWDSGLRLGDLLALDVHQIAADGTLIVKQHKTGWPVICRLRPETMAAIEATFPPRRDRIFGQALGRDQTFKQFRALVERAAIPKGGTKRIRKSSATAVERETPGAAMLHLGHRTAGLAYAHYVDPTKLNGNKPLPPRLGG